MVGGLVSSHHLYPQAARLFGDLLAGGTSIVLSDLVINESLWVLARLAYCDLTGQPPSAHWTKAIYVHHQASIFLHQGAKLSAIRDWLAMLDAAGHPIDVVRSTKGQWIGVVDRTLAFMKDFGLTPADAAHLALAEIHAQTFVTADGDYRKITGSAAPQGLTVLIVQSSSGASPLRSQRSNPRFRRRP